MCGPEDTLTFKADTFCVEVLHLRVGEWGGGSQKCLYIATYSGMPFASPLPFSRSEFRAGEFSSQAPNFWQFLNVSSTKYLVGTPRITILSGPGPCNRANTPKPARSQLATELQSRKTRQVALERHTPNLRANHCTLQIVLFCSLAGGPTSRLRIPAKAKKTRGFVTSQTRTLHPSVLANTTGLEPDPAQTLHPAQSRQVQQTNKKT